MEKRNTEAVEIPYFVYQEEVYRLKEELGKKDEQIDGLRHGIVTVVVVALITVLLVVCLHIYFQLQYDYTSTETITVDGGTGTANYIGRDGDVYNGKDYGQESPQTD